MPYIGNPIYQSAFVTDQFSGDGTTTAFTMSVAPAGTTNVLVVVSGVVQDPSTYGVVGTTLNFSAAPPSGTGNISCRYLGVPVTGVTTTAYRTVTEFTATASQTTFTPPSYNVGFINVYLNGVLLASTDYTASNGTTVVLATGASAGNILTVESFRIESVANAISNTAGAINLAGTLISGTLPVANGGTGVTTSTGSGSNVLSAAPTFTGQATIPTINLTGGQITFPATAVPSSNANTLDDYEEGTWTPSWNVSGGSWTSSSVVATYTKIGRQVTCSMYWVTSAISGTKVNELNGFPFTSANDGNKYSISIAANSIGLSGAIPVSTVNANSTGSYMQFSYQSTTGWQDFLTSAISSGSTIVMTFTYFTA